jgi:uncharacterized protein DUF29
MAMRQVARIDLRGAAPSRKLLAESPSLRPYPAEYLPEAYGNARRKALEETGLLSLPDACPWTIDEVMTDDFSP